MAQAEKTRLIKINISLKDVTQILRAVTVECSMQNWIITVRILSKRHNNDVNFSDWGC